MKTKGQRLYEHKSPPMLSVVHASARQFGAVFAVPNENHTPWRFLTAECKAGWERTAVGHNLFSGERDWFKLDGAADA